MSSVPADKSKYDSINILNSKIVESILFNDYLVLNMVYTKLYTANKTDKNWLYSDLKGILSVVIDYKRQSSRFIMIDSFTYQILFEAELYKNFSSHYNKVNDEFQYFEINNGFIGFLIQDSQKNKASNFYHLIKNLTDDQILKLLKRKKNYSSFEITKHSEVIANMLKVKIEQEKFKVDNSTYNNDDKTIALTGRQLEKTINSIYFDKDAYFKMKGHNPNLSSLLRKAQCFNKVEDKRAHIGNLHTYSKCLSKSIINSLKFIKLSTHSNSIKIPTKERSFVEEEVVDQQRLQKYNEFRESKYSKYSDLTKNMKNITQGAMLPGMLKIPSVLTNTINKSDVKESKANTTDLVSRKEKDVSFNLLNCNMIKQIPVSDNTNQNPFSSKENTQITSSDFDKNSSIYSKCSELDTCITGTLTRQNTTKTTTTTTTTTIELIKTSKVSSGEFRNEDFRASFRDKLLAFNKKPSQEDTKPSNSSNKEFQSNFNLNSILKSSKRVVIIQFYQELII